MADQKKISEKAVEKAAIQQHNRSKKVPRCLLLTASDEFDTGIHRKMLRALNESDNVEVSMDKKSSKINNQRIPQLSEGCNEVIPDFPMLMEQPPLKKIKKSESKEEKMDKEEHQIPVKEITPNLKKESKAPTTIKGPTPTKANIKPYKCQQCSKDFPTNSKLQTHMLVHSDVRAHICDIVGCGSSFKSAYHLKRHQLVHTNVRAFSCNEVGCGQSFKTACKLKDHAARHSDERPFLCDAFGCNKTFKTAYDLKDHIKRHPEERLSVCHAPDCGCSFASVTELRQHQLVHINVRRYTCNVVGCGCSFTTALDLQNHMKKHPDERPFVCDSFGCNKTFRTVKDLKDHAKRHSDERPFVCNFIGCNKKFKTAKDLKDHVKTHSDERLFVCDTNGCNKTFKMAKDLKRHKLTHSSDKKYSCEVCPYITHNSSHFARHKMLHTGEKPYSCDKCEYACISLDNMRKHMLSHTDDRPFICPICDFATKSQELLKSHNKVHQGAQPYKCHLCQYKTAEFLTKDDLDRHCRISHNKGKNLTCAHCPRVCSSSQALQQHEILHAVSTGTRHNPNTILNYLDEAPENGTQRCTTPNCITCNYILSRSEIPLAMNKDEDDDNYSIPTLFNCKSKSVIYLISCSKCGAKYIGETARELRERFGQHMRAFADNCDRNLYQHFHQVDHSEEHIHIEVLCHASTDPQQRRIQESSFMLMFATYGKRNSLNMTISRLLF